MNQKKFETIEKDESPFNVWVLSVDGDTSVSNGLYQGCITSDKGGDL